MVWVTEIQNVFDPINSRKTTLKEPNKPLSSYLPLYYKELVVAIDGVITKDYEQIISDDTQIILAPILQGGGSGKNVLRAVAFIALAVAAGPLAGAVNTSLFGGSLAADSLGMSLLKVGVMAAGGLLINAVLPPQAPLDSYSNLEKSPSFSWTSSKSIPRPGAPIPVLYGQYRVAGSVIGQYLEDQGDDQYLYMQLLLCEGEIEDIAVDDILIDGNELSKYNDVAYTFRNGTVDQLLTVTENFKYLQNAGTKHMQWFNKITTANVFSTELVYNTAVEKTTSGTAVEGIQFEIVFPNGLFYINNNGTFIKRSVDFKVEYKKTTDTVWTVWQQVIPGTYQTLYEWVSYDYYLGWSYQWSDVSPGSGWWKNGRAKTVWVDAVYSDTWSISAATQNTIRRQFTIEDLPADQYDIRITKLTPDVSSSREVNTMYWSGFNEINNTKLYYPFIALLGIKIKATGQLSGTAPTIATLIRRKDIEVFDENGVSQGLKRSDNPAWVAWDILTNKRYGLKKDYSRVDFAAFAAFADWCDENVQLTDGSYEPRAKFNGLIDFQTNLWEALQKVCSVGHAAPILKGTKYSITVDKPSTPVQLFTMGNIIEKSFKVSYTSIQDLSNEIEISFIDQSADYTKQLVSVVLGEGGKKTSITSLGTTTQTQAYRLGKYLLECNDKLRRVVEFEAGIDSIACSVGDVIYFAHDVPQWGYSGRVVDISSNSITLDREVYCETTKSYLSIVRKLNDSIITINFNPVSADGNYTILEFAEFAAGRVINGQKPDSIITNTIGGATPSTTTFTKVIDGGTPTSTYDYVRPYDVYTFGETNKEYLKLRVNSISRKDDLTRRLVCLEYNEGILSFDTVPDPIARPSLLTGFPTISDLEIKEHLEKRNDGTIVPFIDFSWRIVDNRMAKVNIFVSDDNGITWTPIAQNLTDYTYSYAALNLAENKEYIFAFPTVDLSGMQSITEATQQTYTYLGKSAPPEDITELNFSKHKTDGVVLSWPAVADVDLKGYNLYKEGILLASNITTTSYTAGLINVDITFSVKAVDTSGNESVNAASVLVPFSGIEAPIVSGIVDDLSLRLEWNEPAADWKIDHYIIEYNGVQIRSDTRAWQIPITWQTETFNVYAVDINGNKSAAGIYTSTIILPTVNSLSIEVIDNNVLFRWDVTEGSLPVINSTIKKGSTWDTAEIIGSKQGTFTTVFEKKSGQYTYWIAAIDAAGNVSTPVSKSAYVSQPPDYVLNANWDSTFSGTRTNAFIDPDTNRLLLPVNTTETFEDHFLNNSWSTPQDQINVGYPIYIEPFQSTASYEEVFDYGATLSATKITVSVTSNIITGSVSETCTISISSDGTTWTDYADTYSVYATGFQYVKIKLDYTGATYGGVEIAALNVVLDSKLISDSGTVYCNAADTGGTAVTFNTSFVDVEAITVTPKGTTQLTAVYDFTDVPNPTTFYIYLYDNNGNRVSGDVSWQARGY